MTNFLNEKGRFFLKNIYKDDVNELKAISELKLELWRFLATHLRRDRSRMEKKGVGRAHPAF